jgi:hypothetical protein
MGSRAKRKKGEGENRSARPRRRTFALRWRQTLHAWATARGFLARGTEGVREPPESSPSVPSCAAAVEGAMLRNEYMAAAHQASGASRLRSRSVCVALLPGLVLVRLVGS